MESALATAKGRESQVPALQTNLLDDVAMDVVFEVVTGALEVMGLTDVESDVDVRGVCARQVHALDSLLGLQFAGTYDGPSDV